MSHSDPHQANQFALLGQRRFAPFFWTQFLGAGNDNLMKFALTVMVTYQLQLAWLPTSVAGLVVAALFVLPFVLFSATSGQIADQWEKSKLIRLVKNLEIGIMLLAAVGFSLPNVPVLLACTFLMGIHSTVFGPVKYAYLPQHLGERELTGGNGMVEMGTFVSILLGNLLGGLLVAIPGQGPTYVAMACVALAVMGRVAAGYVPHSPATDPSLRINWNPITETMANLKLAHGHLAVFRSLLGISWLWFFGAVFLSQFPSLAKQVLKGDEHVASVLLMTFSLGIGLGSLLCERLSRSHVEIGLVPLGSIGMTVFGVDLYFACQGLPDFAGVYSFGTFVAEHAHWRLMADLFLLSMFAGIYSVPMYALIQIRTPSTHRARIIAANNILNSLFMVVSSLLAAAMLASHFTIPEVLLATAVLNAVVAIYIFSVVPEYFLRFLALILSRCIYRMRIEGVERIPSQGPALLVCNHVSYVDAVLLMAASPRPIRFIMDHRIFRTPVLGTLFRLAKCIPIAPYKDDPACYEEAFRQARAVLADDELLCIFPEGGITRDGQLQPFKGGVAKILADHPVPVIPLALHNLWGSYFSRIEGAAMTKPFRRGWFNRVGLTAGDIIPAERATPEALQEAVSELLAHSPLPSAAGVRA